MDGTEPRQVIIAANPTAGAKAVVSPVERLVRAIDDMEMSASVETDLDVLAEAVADVHAAGKLRAVVAAGGDGTAAAVVNRIAADVPLVPYPLGTENLLARYLGIRAIPEQICRIIQNGETRQLDAGSANGRLFLLMASCGIDAEVVRRVQDQRQGHIDHLTYVQPVFESLQNYTYPEIRVVALDDDQTERSAIPGKWAFVINLPRYAGGLRIVREAVGNDGLLDICVFKRGSAIQDLVFLTGVFFGQHQGWSDCEVRQARRLRIESDDEVPYQLDGDFGGHLPVDIEVLPERVTLLVESKDAAQN